LNIVILLHSTHVFVFGCRHKIGSRWSPPTGNCEIRFRASPEGKGFELLLIRLPKSFVAIYLFIFLDALLVGFQVCGVGVIVFLGVVVTCSF
jgi:hypothetical protein